MSQYRTGTVALSYGTTTVVGTNTKWNANIVAGDMLKVEDINAIFTIDAVFSDTALRLSVPYPSSSISGYNYQIHRDFTDNYKIPEINEGDRDWPFFLTRGLRIIDEVNAGGTVSSTLYETTSSLINQGYNGITARMYDSGSNGFGKVMMGSGTLAGNATTTTLPAVQMAVSTVTVAGYNTALIHGFVKNLAWNFPSSDIGFPIYVDVSGGLTTTALAASKYQQIVGIVIDTSTVFFNPSFTWVAT